MNFIGWRERERENVRLSIFFNESITISLANEILMLPHLHFSSQG